MAEIVSLYLHIPFCRTRCTYCTFNTYTHQDDLIPAYVRALQRELTLVGQATPANTVVNTIYFGGGTPSLLPAAAVATILDQCQRAFTCLPNLEISLEANPGTVDRSFLVDLRASGVNRISIGMQTAHAQELKLFARGHHLDDVIQTVHLARAAGFDNLNLDLIYGTPHQTLAMWQSSLNTACQLAPDHLSLYSLGVEKATPFERWIAEGTLPMPDPDLAADMYEWASDQLATAGFAQYEISNWARPGFACQHNVHVWHNLPYLGFGAGAHGYAAQTRYVNAALPATYIERIDQQRTPQPFPCTAAAETTEFVTEDAAQGDMLVLGLRLIQQGISPVAFQARFGRDLWEAYGAELTRLIEYGLLECTADNGVKLSSRGRLLGNHVFAAFV